MCVAPVSSRKFQGPAPLTIAGTTIRYLLCSRNFTKSFDCYICAANNPGRAITAKRRNAGTRRGYRICGQHRTSRSRAVSIVTFPSATRSIHLSDHCSRNVPLLMGQCPPKEIYLPTSPAFYVPDHSKYSFWSKCLLVRRVDRMDSTPVARRLKCSFFDSAAHAISKKQVLRLASLAQDDSEGGSLR